MSADNIIYIQKIKNKWNVWHASASDESPKPKNAMYPRVKKFEDKYNAYDYAWELEEEIGYVEYGVCKI